MISPKPPIYLERVELKHGWGLDLSNVQGILKFTLPEDRYIEMCKESFARYGLDSSVND